MTQKKETLRLRNFLLAAFFAGLTAVGGILSIPVPPMPFTMQSFFVLMSGLFLGPKFGPLSQVIYIMMGLAGAPILAGGAGGIHHIFAPSFGFLIAYIPVSWVAGMLGSFIKPDQDGPAALYVKYLLVCLAATVVLYAIGLPAFYFNMYYVMGTPLSLTRVFQLSLIPFIIPDFIKAAVAAGLACKTVTALRGAGLR